MFNRWILSRQVVLCYFLRVRLLISESVSEFKTNFECRGESLGNLDKYLCLSLQLYERFRALFPRPILVATSLILLIL